MKSTQVKRLARPHTRRTVIIRFADLDLAVVARRQSGPARQLALWYTLRLWDKNGTGRVNHGCVWQVCRFLHMHPRTAQRVLAGGDGVFWTRTPDRTLYMHCPA